MRVLWLLLVLAAPLGAQPLTFVNEGGPPGVYFARVAGSAAVPFVVAR